jgi:8-amino-7-oxononanoate synthase
MTERDTSADVAIIGMACRFAGADDVDQFWENLVSGKTSFGPVPEDRWNHDDFRTDRFRERDKTYVRQGAFIDDVDSFGSLHFGIAPRRVQTMDPQHRMVLETTRVALQDAGVEKSSADRETMGTFLGVSTSEYRNLVTSRTMAMLMAGGTMGDSDGTGEALSKAVENVAPISAFSMPGTLLNMAAANVANQWQLGGPAFTVDAACASSLLAVHDAVTHIRAGICRTALAGGVYLNLTPESIIGFSRIGAISQKGECRPFDAEADGFLQGDGCGVVVLKDYDQAVADGDRIYAVIRGSGVNNDAGSSSGPMAPSLEGQIQSVRRAYQDADVDPRTVDFVSCHGTATPVGDPVEVGALRTVMSADDPEHSIYLGSVKANVGHTMSAAGVAGLIHAVLSLSHGQITPQAGYENPHPNLELDDGPFVIPTEPVEWKTNGHPRRAGVSAFGFGGTNCHLVVEEAPSVEPAPETGPQTVVLSAENRELLARHASQIADEVERRDLALADVAYTLSVTRNTDKARLALVADDAESLVAELRRAAKLLDGEEAPGMLLGPNAFWGEERADGIAFMFPGQGAQRLGLFADLYERYPAFAAHLDRLSDSVEDLLEAPIRDFLYPEEESEEAAEALKATETCQPVMAAVGLALAAFLKELGIEPDVTLGHSLGEFAAAAAGGMLSDEDAVQFVARRGRLMADLDVGDFGAMAAVMAGADEVQPHLVEGAGIANLNHPQQTVISGTTPAVETVADALTDEGIKTTLLRVSHAFHSPVVESVVEPMTSVIEALSLSESAVPVISAITGEPYDDVDETRRTWAEHTTSPVDFMAALEAASELADVFVEIGAGSTLTAFTQGTLGDRVRAVRSLGAKKPNEGRDFQRAIAMLVAAGVDVDFAPLWSTRRVVSLPPAPLVRTKHWVVRDRTVSLDVPEASKRGDIVTDKSTDKTDAPSEDLVALFREQNEILRQHASIIAAQNAALAGGKVELPEQPAVHLEAPAEQPAPKASTEDVEQPVTEVIEATQEESGVDYQAMVLDAVAGVSAFPADALELDQQLAADLGFDSLMFVDLGADLQKRIPGLEIPQDAFDQSTTIGDVIAFLEETVGDEELSTEAAAVEQPDELHRWTVDWSAVPSSPLAAERFAPEGIVAVTTDGADDEATAFAETLEARGVRTRIVDLDDTKDLGDATALVHFARRDESWDVEHVVELRRLAAALLESSDGAPEAFVTVTSADADPALRGAFRGFAKALAREWPDTRVLGAQIDDEEVARHLFGELDDATRYVEVRWRGGGREVPLPSLADDDAKELSFSADEVVAITGGAKGIGLRCATALVESTDATLVLIGRSEESDVSDALATLRKHGTVKYVSWDVTEPNADAFGELSPTAVIHSAGVIRDARVEDKSDEDVRLVTGVKVDGLRNVLEAAGKELKLVVGFGSWTGRFGNVQQTDYAAGNDAVTEMLRELATDRCRAVNIDWPFWEDSAMTESLSEGLQDAMRARGVTFVSPKEGVEAFLAELGRSYSGEVIFGREMTRREAPFRARFEASVDSFPYVADHVLRDAPVLPFASALDWMGAAAERAGDRSGPMVLRDVQLFKGIELSEPAEIDVSADVTRRHGTAEVHAGGELAYRAKVAFEDVDLTIPDAEGDAVTPSLDLDTFYEKHSFHGPKIRGIAGVDEIAPEWLVGRVKTSTPATLLERDTDERWTIDPLVIDATFQLVLYHLQSLHGIAAFPTGIDEYVQLRDFTSDEVRCTLVLDEMTDGKIVGTIRFEDDQGVVAVMRCLRAKEFDFDAASDDDGIEVDEKFWKIEEFPEVKALEQRLQMADLIGIRNPYFWPHEGPARNTAVIEGKEMINYSSYNYCGFSGHPEVTKAAQDAAEEYGTSVSASRIASGQIPLHQELEDAIADFIGTEASLVFSAGHMTNETCIGHLFGKEDLIIHDSLAHNSILTGAELSGAKRMQFPHNDWEALDRILGKLRGNFEKVGIFIEGVYSMDGDIPDLPKFIEVKKRHKCLLYVDEAHSMGCIGSRGAGISDYFGLDPMEVDVWMGTLSKSFASCGGYITGSSKLIEYLKYTAPAFVFSAGISPANAGAALASVTLLSESPEIPQTLQARADFFLEECQKRGIDTGMSKDSAVVPAIVGNSMDCLKLSQRLADRGINVQPIVYPAVEDESSRLRFFLSAVHTEEELEKTAELVAEELANVRSGAAAE